METSAPAVTVEHPPMLDHPQMAAEPRLVDEETVLVLEHHRKLDPPEALGQLPLYRSRRHSDSVVSIYAKEDAS